jgi:hypothetical protein
MMAPRLRRSDERVTITVRVIDRPAPYPRRRKSWLWVLFGGLFGF